MAKQKLWDYFFQIHQDYDFDELFLKPGKTLLRLKENFMTVSNSFPEEHLKTLIQELVIANSERLDPLQPFASGELSALRCRFVAMIPPITNNPEIILRRNVNHQDSDFAGYQELQKTLSGIFEREDHLIICGVSGAGKTTLLKKIMNDFLGSERIVILDSFMEWGHLPVRWTLLQESPGFFDGRGTISMLDLFSLSLRLSAERFVLGEIKYREIEVFHLLRNVGHGSVLTTMHGSNLRDIEARLGSLERTKCLLLEENYKCRLLE